MTRRLLRRLGTTAVLVSCIAGAGLAQSVVRGRVLTGAMMPVINAELSVPSLNVTVRSDSTGAYELRGLVGAEAIVVVRAVGYRGDSAAVGLQGAQVVTRDFVLDRLAPTQTLPTVDVVTPRHTGVMAGFYDRKQQGIGRFIDRETLQKWDGRRTSELFATIPGLAVKYVGSGASATSTRATSTNRCAFCQATLYELLTPADVSAGARPACYMDVYLNGALVYQYGTTPAQPLFNMNELPPSAIEAVEVYTSAAQIPAAYNRTSSGCGVVLIWSRISRLSP